MHPKAENRPSFTIGISTTSYRFAYQSFGVFSDISSQGFTPRFHSPKNVPMVGIDDIHKHIIGMLQQVIKYCKNMYVVLLEMLGQKLANQQVEQKRTHVQNYWTCKNTNSKIEARGPRMK